MAERKPIIAGNWKMNKTHLEAISIVRKLSYDLGEPDYARTEVVVCPPFTALRSVQLVVEDEHIPIALGAQNVHWEPEGAFTGEISAGMLSELHCSYVILGHSERRQHFGETDETVNKRIRAALGADLVPIICVGETLSEREAGRTEEVVGGQLRGGLAGFRPEELMRIVLAYEPVWAIGTDRAASPEDANDTIGFVRKTLAEVTTARVADEIRIQYGGSVSPGNIASFMSQAEIDGALVGGASLDPKSFSMIVRY